MQFLTAFRIVTNLGFLGGVPHNILPVLVHDLEQPALLRHLLHDVLRGEDGLQIQPLGLHLQPLVNGVLDPQQPLLPILTADNSKNTSQISLESFKEMQKVVRSKRVKIKLFFPNLYNFFFMGNFYYVNIPIGEIFHFCEFFKVSNNFLFVFF